MNLAHQQAQLWTEHVVATREVILGVVENRPFGGAVQRLEHNKTQLADTLKPFFGGAVGDQFGELLNEHLDLALEILLATSQGDEPKAKLRIKQWYDNGQDIAYFLGTVNSQGWPFEAMRDQFRQHLDITLEEANAEFGGRKSDGEAYFKQALRHITSLAKMLADGITIWKGEGIGLSGGLSIGISTEMPTTGSGEGTYLPPSAPRASVPAPVVLPGWLKEIVR